MRRSLALILLLSLTACQLFTPLPDENSAAAAGPSVPVEQLYADAQSEIKDGNYEKAVKLLERLQARYPYGRYAQQAQMEIAYAHYKQREPDPALAAADRFIKQYPNNPNVDYVYYLKGLITFNSDLGIFGDLFLQDLSERDPKSAQESFEAFRELVTRFPDSRYTPDAKVRMQYLINALARSEIYAANYYLRRGAHMAALNRAKTVLTTYPQTPQAVEALQIMVKAYDALGMTDLRDDTQRVLVKNTGKAGTIASEAAWWQFWKR
ncbi:MAG: outer membrane protein assembly factor BamD [Nitrosomonadales bacterium]|nr:outer membrane protein assembly factor BamD [Nitrosomonadales bacterium]